MNLAGAAALAWGGGAVAALLLPRRAGRLAAAALAALGAAAAAGAGLAAAGGLGAPTASLPSAVPGLGLLFRLDPLGAFFLCLVGAVAVPAAIYGAGYARDTDPGLRLQGALLNLFLLSMAAVVAADDVFTFLFSWETMALASLLLIVGPGDSEERRHAGLWYGGMAHAGFALIAAALLLAQAQAGDGGFGVLRGAAAAAPPAVRNAVFLLALAGFASKCGIVPLHVWLPRAHPAAPSHVSALLSGAMLAVGVYGLLRVGLDLLGGGPPWWGWLVLALGVASALTGVLYALVEHDLKRLLAWSSIENLGLVFIGAGAAMTFGAYGMAAAASLALMAALFHVLNHALFKTLLFLGAGSVLRATKTRDLEALGGLIGAMPVTAACMLAGSAAIAALPPLNGFVGEWMLFQALMAGVGAPHPFVTATLALTAGALALTGGLAAVCFVRAFGICFLALPRSAAAAEAVESPAAMRVPMIALAASCAVLGVFPALARGIVSAAAAAFPGTAATEVVRFGYDLEVRSGFGRIAPPLLLAVLLGAAACAWAIVRWLDAGRRRGATWGCGRIGQTARMQYTAAAFAEPLRRVFGDLLRPTRDLAIEFHPESKYFVRSIRYRSRVRLWFEEDLYGSLFRLVRPLRGWGRLIQSGSVHLYITYVFLALLGFLLVAQWM